MWNVFNDNSDGARRAMAIRRFATTLQDSMSLEKVGVRFEWHTHTHTHTHTRTHAHAYTHTHIHTHSAKPVIAVVHSACVGGGVDLLSACDIRLASTDAFFQIKVGQVCNISKRYTYIRSF